MAKHIQFYDKFWREHTFPKTEEGAHQSFDTWKREYQEYSPPVTTSTIQRWKDRAVNLKNEADLGSVVSKFDQLDQEFLPIEEKVIEAVVAYDMSMDV